MSNSNALDNLINNGGAQFVKEEYKAMAENIIAALKSHGSDIVRDALNGISDFEIAFFFLLWLISLNVNYRNVEMTTQEPSTCMTSLSFAVQRKRPRKIKVVDIRECQVVCQLLQELVSRNSFILKFILIGLMWMKS